MWVGYELCTDGGNAVFNMMGTHLDHFKEGGPVGGVHQAVVEDPVDLMYPESDDLLAAVGAVRGDSRLQQQHALKRRKDVRVIWGRREVTTIDYRRMEPCCKNHDFSLGRVPTTLYAALRFGL